MVLAASASRADQRSDLEKVLKQRYEGQILNLRACYAASSLKFDAQGSLLGTAPLGGCAANQSLRVDGMRLRDGKLKIDARRVIAFFEVDGTRKALATHDSRSIELDLGAGMLDPDAIGQALAKVFRTSKDPPLQPPPTVEQYKSERFEFKPGKPLMVREKGSSDWQPQAKINESVDVGALDDGQPLYIFSHGIKPPEPLKTVDPEYPGGFPGVSKDKVVLLLVIDNVGFVRTVQLRQPVTSGAERSAVEAVSQWTFRPATSQGKPIAVTIYFEVNFHP